MIQIEGGKGEDCIVAGGMVATYMVDVFKRTSSFLPPTSSFAFYFLSLTI
ncbi:hypothetical protein [Chryseobacterium sp. CH21]|nr:hypothetical protein [Chryseobacterium sp. CH21]